MTDFAIWIHTFDISVDFELPTFDAPTAIYANYAPGIMSIEKTSTYAGLTKYRIDLDQSTTIKEVRKQIENLAAFHAQECDNAEFYNAETELETA